jgi:type 1 glutamine amidotransferase/nicotinamidase-related amidase
MRTLIPAVLMALVLVPALAIGADARRDNVLRLTARARAETASKSGPFEVVEKPLAWNLSHTAVIVCDMWDKHWCEGANRRGAVIAPRINELVKAVRARGGFIVHAPSDTMKNYEGTPQRKLAKDAPTAKAPLPFKWNYIDLACETKLPIDDSDGGCDDQPQCKNHIAWKGEHPAVEIAAGDAVSDQGQEIWNLFQQRGIDNVLICGVHTNMCVLGRSFGIRQLTRLGKNVALVRDLTDTMYNPRMPPFVSHGKGTELVIAHVEKYWCPTVLSSDVLAVLGVVGAAPAPKPHVVIVASEEEYHAKETLPAFAKDELEGKLGWGVTVLQSDSKTDLPGLDALKDADLLVTFIRRRTLPPDQLGKFQAYFEAGKPVVALRTSSHAFQNWLEFDKQVLGGNYHNHYGNTGATHVTLADGGAAAGHPILRGVTPFDSAGSLYMASPLAPTATPLLTGTWQDKPAEPVAWTNTYKGGRVFYTSLGHPKDFESPQFRRLLVNAMHWAADQPVPAASTAAAK